MDLLHFPSVLSLISSSLTCYQTWLYYSLYTLKKRVPTLHHRLLTMSSMEKKIGHLNQSKKPWEGTQVDEISGCLEDLSKVSRYDDEHTISLESINDLVVAQSSLLAGSLSFVAALCKVTDALLRQTTFEPAHKSLVICLQMWNALVDVGKKPDLICSTLHKIGNNSVSTLRGLLQEMGKAKSSEAQELILIVMCKLLLLMTRLPHFNAITDGIFKDCSALIRTSLRSPHGPFDALKDITSCLNSINAENNNLKTFQLTSVAVKEIKKQIKGYRNIIGEGVLEVGFFQLAIFNDQTAISVPYSAIEMLHVSPGCIQVAYYSA